MLTPTRSYLPSSPHADSNIKEEVFRAIEYADTFIAFGSKHYGEDTGNSASTYKESMFVENLKGNKKKRIIRIRMIPFEEDFEHLQGRTFFGMNDLEIPWMLGEPMPPDLPAMIIEAMGMPKEMVDAAKANAKRRAAEGLAVQASSIARSPGSPKVRKDGDKLPAQRQHQALLAEHGELMVDHVATTAASVINSPGRWDAMISYTQRNAVSEALASRLHEELNRRGKTVWLDVQMSRRDKAAMKEGVENSHCVIAIVSGPPGDENAYFCRDFCLSELRWAKEAGVPVVPIVAAEDKGKITEFFVDVPADLEHLKSANWEHIDRKDRDYFVLGVTKICKAASLAEESRNAVASRFSPGDRVKYNSVTHGGWHECRVAMIHADGRLRLSRESDGKVIRDRADPELCRSPSPESRSSSPESVTRLSTD